MGNFRKEIFAVFLLLLASISAFDPSGLISVTRSTVYGPGLLEGVVNAPAKFSVSARDVFGSPIFTCSGEDFKTEVRVLAVRPVSDECETIGNCTKCWRTTTCLVECVEGSYEYEYVSEMSGYVIISVAAKDFEKGWIELGGGPWRAHVEDGSLFLPGFSFAGYTGIVLMCMLSSIFVLGIMFAFAVRAHKRVGQEPTMDQREMQMLEDIARELEEQSLLERRWDDENAGGRATVQGLVQGLGAKFADRYSHR